MSAMDRDFVDVNGLRLAYQRAGHGPALLLLHGAYDDSRAWSRQLGALSDEFTVVAWDAPGCGASDDPPETFTASDYPDAIAGFLAGIGIPRAHVLGLSWGSMLALQLYERHPAAVASLLLASAYAGWVGSLPPEEVQRRVRQVLREVELPPDAFIPDWIPTLLTSSAPPHLVEEITGVMRDFHPAGMRRAVLCMRDLDLRPMLSSIVVPTLLLYGDQDVRSPLPVARDLHDRIPGSRLVVLPGAPHLANVEAPEQFNGAVRAFLADVLTA